MDEAAACDRMAGRLEAISAVLPLTCAFDALARTTGSTPRAAPDSGSG
jgi:hypothetical protein